MLGSTIVSGGYIRTDLIDAQTIVANALAAGRITTGNITVTDGAYLGGWEIKNNAIYSRNVADAKIQLEISGTRFLRINQYGGGGSANDPLMTIRNDGQSCLTLETYGDGGNALKELKVTAPIISRYLDAIFTEVPSNTTLSALIEALEIRLPA